MKTIAAWKLPLVALGLAVSQFSLADDKALDAAIASDSRAEANVARDKFRHPKETLAFFGVKPDMSVVEIWPGGGWYTEILGPYLSEKGTLYAGHFPADTEVGYYTRSLEKFKEKVAADKASYGSVKVTEFFPKDGRSPAPSGSADMVLTFRNVHNWMRGSHEQKAFEIFFDALKPGGVLGVVEHRAKPGTSLDGMIKSGYVTEQHVIDMATKAGFVLEEKSEVNANAKDSADHPKGVWTLPPRLALDDQDRDKYVAIGESDRMTLKFRKPAK